MQHAQRNSEAFASSMVAHLLRNADLHPAAREDEEGKYEVTSAAETISILRETSEQGALISLNFNHGKDLHLLTSTVEVSGDGKTIILDQARNLEVNRKALASERIDCLSLQERGKIQFVLDGVAPGHYAGREVFLSAMPDSLIRLQRREDYRLIMPQANPVIASVPWKPADSAAVVLQAVAIDISGGGMCIRLAPNQPSLDKDANLSGVSFMLPGAGAVRLDMRVRNIRNETMPNGKIHQRAVCQFLDLPKPMMNLIQRYIFQVQRERNARGVF